MMKLQSTLSAILVSFALCFGSVANADMAFFGSYIQTTANGTPTWYALTGIGSSLPDFDGASLGSFSQGIDSLLLTDGQGLTFKNGNSNVTNVDLFFSVQPTGTGHSSFTQNNLGFTADAPFSDAAGNNFETFGDQLWSEFGPSVDILTGLTNGDYEFQVFLRGQGTGFGGPEFFHSNNGANYTATFSVVPEPVSAITFGIACGLICRRCRPRRR